MASRWGGLSHAFEPAVVGAETFSEGGLDEVGDLVFFAGLLHDLRERGIMDVGDAGEEVVFDLVVEAAAIPSHQAVMGGKIHGGFGLVLIPIGLDAVGGFVEFGEAGFFNAMCHLKDDSKDESLNEGCCKVEEQDHTDGMKEKGDCEHPRHKDGLADKKLDERPAFGTGNGIFSDTSDNEIVIIIKKLPFDAEKAVKKPHIEVLEAVEREVCLVGGETGEEADFEVGIVFIDIGVRMVEVIVFPMPKMIATAEEFEACEHQAIDPLLLGVGVVAAVVHDIEADPGERKARRDGEKHNTPPRKRKREKEAIRSAKPEEEGQCLDVDLGLIVA